MFVGSLLCLAAAVLYAAVYVCLRFLSHSASSTWALCVKETVGVVLVGPWLLWQGARGRRVLPAGSAVLALVLTGLATQVVANVAQFWAFSVVGLSIAVPVTMGMNLVSSAVLGQMLLGERVRLPATIAIGLLIAAIALLSLGVPQAQDHSAAGMQHTHGEGTALLGVAAAILAGVVYSLLAVTIRRTVTDDTPPALIVFVVTAMGTLSLGPLSWYRCGLPALWGISTTELLVMLASGVMNLLAFFALIKGFELTSVVRANLLSSSQTAFAAIAGMQLFHEPRSLPTLLGISLTMIGLMVINYPARKA